MGDFSEINTKNGVWGKRQIELLDRSMADEKFIEKDKSKWGTKMNATLWGEIAKKPTFDEGDLIGIRNVGISEFQGSWQLNIGDESSIYHDVKKEKEA